MDLFLQSISYHPLNSDCIFWTLGEPKFVYYVVPIYFIYVKFVICLFCYINIVFVSNFNVDYIQWFKYFKTAYHNLHVKKYDTIMNDWWQNQTNDKID